MAGFIDKVSSLPKPVLVGVGVVLLGVLGYGMYWFSFGSKKSEEAVVENIDLGVPDAPVENYENSPLKEFGKAGSGSTVADYWSSLGEEDEEEIPAVSTSMEDELDPTVYSEVERYQIRSGLRRKEDIDREHALDEAARKAEEQRRRQEAAAQAPRLTQAQQDSLYFARLERAYALAAKYTAPAVEEEAGEPAEEQPQDRTVDLSGAREGSASLPVESMSDDGIITSLDEPSESDVVHYGGGAKIKPVKATFLKNERLVSGNRVIIRLMQDMVLSDGTMIPANTHITGTCSFNRRLKINVSMLHYNGRMFPVDISVYDNDGTEGIYCPLAEESSSKAKKVKKVAGDVVQSAGSLAGTLITGNPFVGRIATQGIQSATSSIGNDGSVSVNVSAGYEFFVYENVKEEGRR